MVITVGRMLVVLLALLSGVKLVASGDEGFERLVARVYLDDEKKEIEAFLVSAEGIEAREIYNKGVQVGFLNYPLELPITKMNFVGFLALQKNVSPRLRKAIDGYLEAGGDAFDKIFLQCLSVSKTDFIMKKWDFVIGGPFRYFSPLFNEICLSGIEFQWAGKTFPEELLMFKELSRLAFTQTHFDCAESLTILDSYEEAFPHLRTLSFLHCTVPEALGKSFKKMPSLTFLSLVDTKVVGSMDAFMVNLPHGLEVLYLNQVGLTKVPDLGLPRLIDLDISNNSLEYPERLRDLVRYRCGLDGWYVRPLNQSEEEFIDPDMPELVSFDREFGSEKNL